LALLDEPFDVARKRHRPALVSPARGLTDDRAVDFVGPRHPPLRRGFRRERAVVEKVLLHVIAEQHAEFFVLAPQMVVRNCGAVPIGRTDAIAVDAPENELAVPVEKLEAGAWRAKTRGVPVVLRP